jgi:SAM-dependent methyltransferase
MNETPDNENTRQRVRSLYERFPYPTPSGDLEAIRQGQVLELGYPSFFFHKYWPQAAYREDLDILVAGCGTLQAARYAAAHPRARVTGIDLSEASLENTRAAGRRHRLDNLAVHRMAVEDAAGLGQTFDLVVSTGVIHHLPEPAAGLQALRQVLRPDGRCYLMLYAPHGRDAIYYLQQLLAALGHDSDSLDRDGIEALSRLVDTLPAEHPLWHRRRQFPDLTQPAELVDYLLHPRDRPYTLAESRELLSGCGLKLQDVFNRAHYAPACSGLADSSLYQPASSDSWRAFDLGEMYRAALTRHDLIAARDDAAPPAQAALLARDPAEIVPVPMPGVQATAGSDGSTTLRWPGHAFGDIRLALDGDESAFFKTVDGHRSLATIRDGLGDTPLGADMGRLYELVRRLADHDYLWLAAPDPSPGRNAPGQP